MRRARLWTVSAALAALAVVAGSADALAAPAQRREDADEGAAGEQIDVTRTTPGHAPTEHSP